jgi:hypothetical protein
LTAGNESAIQTQALRFGRDFECSGAGTANRRARVMFSSGRSGEQFFGGLGPGLLSVALSALAFRYLFLRRIIPPTIEGAAFLRFSIFLLATLRRPLVGWWPTFVRRQLSLYLPGNAVIH